MAPPDIAARIERAHQDAVADVLRFIETHAPYTRTGINRVRQVDVPGLVGTAFTHRDSRAGDPRPPHPRRDRQRDPDPGARLRRAPDCAELDGGRWLAIDGRILFKAVVTGSETYNTALETRLRDDHDLRFQDRAPDALSGATPSPTAAGDSHGGCARGTVTSLLPRRTGLFRASGSAL